MRLPTRPRLLPSGSCRHDHRWSGWLGPEPRPSRLQRRRWRSGGWASQAVLQASAAWWEAAVAATDGGRSGRLDGVVVGLLADPDLPAELAERLAGGLPGLPAGRPAGHAALQIPGGAGAPPTKWLGRAGSGASALISPMRSGSWRSPARVGRGKAGIWWSALPTCPAALACGRSWPGPVWPTGAPWAPR